MGQHRLEPPDKRVNGLHWIYTSRYYQVWRWVAKHELWERHHSKDIGPLQAKKDGWNYSKPVKFPAQSNEVK